MLGPRRGDASERTTRQVERKSEKWANCTRAAFVPKIPRVAFERELSGELSQDALRSEKDAPPPSVSSFANAVNRASLYVTRRRPMFSNLRRMNAGLCQLVGREFTSGRRCSCLLESRILDINQTSARKTSRGWDEEEIHRVPSLFRRSCDAVNRTAANEVNPRS